MTDVGCIGLGNMGSELATNLVAAGHDVVTHDVAGAARSPEGATFVADVAAVAARAAVVVLSLPDGRTSRQVAHELAAAPDRRVTHVVDTSTIGLEAARAIDALLEGEGIAYVDAPVSGGPAGARARTLTIMYAGAAAACEIAEAVLAGLSDVRFRVGARPGMGQAMKLANNFLSATALAATSEAIAFGTSVGLDMGTMLDVLNASSGRSTATSDKFVNHVATGRYASGFANTLMAKDVDLYLRSAISQDTPHVVGEVIADVWQRFAETDRGVDFTRIYTFVGAVDS
jgi:3-hydroxyisobutyrate dehydrogenase-like beta-hydroxyacid dehydrogenase